MEDLLLIILIVIIFIYLNLKNENFENTNNISKSGFYSYYLKLTDKIIPYSYSSTIIGSILNMFNK